MFMHAAIGYTQESDRHEIAIDEELTQHSITDDEYEDVGEGREEENDDDGNRSMSSDNSLSSDRVMLSMHDLEVRMCNGLHCWQPMGA